MLHSNFPAHLLADANNVPILRIAVPLMVLLILSALLVGALAVVRKKMNAGPGAVAPRDFSLGDLRSLHREGKLTTEEFERAKAKLVSSVRATLKKEVKPSIVEQPFSGEFKETFADSIPKNGRQTDQDDDGGYDSEKDREDEDS